MKSSGKLYVLLPKALATKLGSGTDYAAPMSRKRSVTDDERKLFEVSFRETIPLAPVKLTLDEPKAKSKTKIRQAQRP